jgi:hypothetical protein
MGTTKADRAVTATASHRGAGATIRDVGQISFGGGQRRTIFNERGQFVLRRSEDQAVRDRRNPVDIPICWQLGRVLQRRLGVARCRLRLYCLRPRS